MRNVIIIKTTGETEVVNFGSDSLSVLQKAVGGWVQAIDLNNNLTLWVNEEGKLEDLPHNALAQHFFDLRFGTGADIIVGDAVLTGGTDSNGDTLGLDDDALKNLVASVTASA
jgi:hypothetical protein